MCASFVRSKRLDEASELSPSVSFSYSFFPFSASVTSAACCRTVGANSLGGSLVPAGLLFQSVQCSLSIKGTSPEGLPLTPTTVPTPSEAKPEFWTSRNGWYTFPLKVLLKVLLRTGSVLGLQGTGDLGSRLGRASDWSVREEAMRGTGLSEPDKVDQIPYL